MHFDATDLEDGIPMQVILDASLGRNGGATIGAKIDDSSRLTADVRCWRALAIEQMEFGATELSETEDPVSGIATDGHEDNPPAAFEDWQCSVFCMQDYAGPSQELDVVTTFDNNQNRAAFCRSRAARADRPLTRIC
jgi:hypothetical protein